MCNLISKEENLWTVGTSNEVNFHVVRRTPHRLQENCSSFEWIMQNPYFDKVKQFSSREKAQTVADKYNKSPHATAPHA